MDRDPRANQLDPVERETPSTGENDTGEVGAEAARISKARRGKRDKSSDEGEMDESPAPQR